MTYDPLTSDIEVMEVIGGFVTFNLLHFNIHVGLQTEEYGKLLFKLKTAAKLEL